ncbi:MAG TPA: hypothetical protein P5087_00830 [Eubacteriales bacterium]|nr:hypothetical protein [Eubacteriales bacterium]
MVTIFNRRLLVKDSSGIELTRITNMLKKEKIQYNIKTVISRGAVGRVLEAKTYYGFNQPYSSDQTYVYFLYVRKNDYEKAKHIASL